jgi:phosphate uptake regulator
MCGQVWRLQRRPGVRLSLAARLIEQVEGEIRRDPGVVRAGVATIFFATHIERIADHATNVAEMIIYLARGKDVRHPDLT